MARTAKLKTPKFCRLHEHGTMKEKKLPTGIWEVMGLNPVADTVLVTVFSWSHARDKLIECRSHLGRPYSVLLDYEQSLVPLRDNRRKERASEHENRACRAAHHTGVTFPFGR